MSTNDLADDLLNIHLNEQESKEITLDEIVEIIKTKSPKIVVFSGAGMSTSAGIPDFRSKDGLYKLIESTMEIETPESVFDLNYFLSNPEPFFLIAKKFVEKEYKPTLSHCFLKVLDDKGLLNRNFTQNIDGLDHKVGIPEAKNIECHGNFRTGYCVKCKSEMSFELMKEQLLKGSIVKCVKKDCTGVVKPAIVFFGEKLPDNIFGNIKAIGEADMAIIIGTSLLVSPFCYFVQSTRKGTPYLILNREEVGAHQIFGKDVCFMKGDCDKSVREICEKLNWVKELDEIHNKFQ